MSSTCIWYLWTTIKNIPITLRVVGTCILAIINSSLTGLQDPLNKREIMYGLSNLEILPKSSEVMDLGAEHTTNILLN